jgi:hypothetical protein
MRLVRQLLEKPLRAYRVLGPLLVVLFLVSGVGSDATPSDGGSYYVGAVSWAGFGLTLLVTVLFTLALVGRSVLGQRSSLD